MIYDVYAAFSAAVTTASATLWAELDINKLVSLTDEFAIRMKRMKSLKNQITYINLEAKLKGFQDSLPLIQVKPEALPIFSISLTIVSNRLIFTARERDI